MTSSTGLISFTILVSLAVVIFAGLIVLEVFLAKMENKFLGFIPPIISFLPTLIYVAAVINSGNFTFGAVISSIFVFFLINIPTIVLLIIYACLRSSKKKKKDDELKRMNIQDL